LKEDEATRAIPIIAVTAFAMAGDERKTLESGCDAYVAKPIMLRPFLETVERFIGTAQQLS
jgi:two-component system cell cycle response regulator DivK